VRPAGWSTSRQGKASEEGAERIIQVRLCEGHSNEHGTCHVEISTARNLGCVSADPGALPMRQPSAGRILSAQRPILRE
jgi:hypothetical protein